MAALVFVGPAMAEPIPVVNPDFETSNLTGWTTTGGDRVRIFADWTGQSSYFVDFDGDGVFASVYQDLGYTVAEGDTYTLRFDWIVEWATGDREVLQGRFIRMDTMQVLASMEVESFSGTRRPVSTWEEPFELIYIAGASEAGASLGIQIGNPEDAWMGADNITVDVEFGTRAENPYPEEEDEHIDIAVELSWDQPPEGSNYTYNIYLGTAPGSLVLVSPAQSQTTYNPDPDLDYVTDYYWRIDSIENGSPTYQGAVWHFTTGGKAWHPAPVDKAPTVSTRTDLSWIGDTFATSYDVYIGKDSIDVANATPSSVEYLDNTGSDPFYLDLPKLEELATYHWRVDQRDGVNNVMVDGDVWNFTTVKDPVRCPIGDLDGDCEVTMDDLLIFAGQWLQETGIANLDGLAGINSGDFALLSENWLGKIGPLVISEFMADNDSEIPLEEGDLLDGNGESSDWIEIYNPTSSAVSLDGWYLTDDPVNLTLWQFPAGLSIPGGGYLVVFASEKLQIDHPGNYPYVDTEGYCHTNFALNNSGDFLALVDPDSVTIVHDYAPEFPEQVEEASYGLYGGQKRYFGTLTPGQPNTDTFVGYVDDTNFSVDRGFYETAFNVIITCNTESSEIRYTLDGSTPTETHGTVYTTTPIHISSTTCLRTAAFRPGWRPGNVDTQTYIFLADVITQPNGSKPGPDWPDPGVSVNDQLIDYGMDPDVINDPRYTDLINDALMAIPTISLVTDLDELFDPATGLYVNAFYYAHHGSNPVDPERPVSIELINPDASEGFQINCGLKMRGNSSTFGSNPKHAFRLLCRNEYGDSKLKFPLFEDEGAEIFDKIDLRTSQNHSWARGHSTSTMIRDVFSRDTQRDMAQPYTRSRYYHLYINGQYWGIYQTQERPESYFAETYLGGERDDFDVLKVYNDLVDGNTDAWHRLWTAATAGFSSNVDYYHVQGLEADGVTPNPTYEKLVDIDNVIEYMLIIYYTGNRDGPICCGSSPSISNNFFAIYNRNTPDGWKSFAHDCENTFESVSVDRTGPYTVGQSFGYFQFQYLHQRLTTNAEYRLRFADYVHKHFFNGGLLTQGPLTDRFMSRSSEIDMAIIAESARWGDAKTSTPFTKDDSWLSAISDIVDDFFPYRTNIVLNQFKAKGWYPNIDAPVFNINGHYMHGGYISAGDSLSITNPGSGTIWYTFNGTDPRLQGGAVSPSADDYAVTGAVALNTTTCVKARVLYNESWSALNEAVYAIGPVAENLRVTEIMYHPQDPPVGDPNSEFIELKNIGAEPLNINLVSFTNGIDFTFGNITLAAGDYIVVVNDLASFQTKYGTGPSIAGEYTDSKLDNGGERIRLADATCQTILDFRYSDGWYEITDGDGFSLTLTDPTDPNPNNWSEKNSWAASTYPGGSPGEDDPTLPDHAVVINEALTHSHGGTPDWIELYNDTDQDINISGWYLSDNSNDDLNLKKYKIADSTIIHVGEYLVFHEDLHFGQTSSDPGRLIPFALNENGEEICVTSAQGLILTGYRKIEDFGAAETGTSFGRYYNSGTGKYNFVPMHHNTMYGVNANPKVWDVVINEIMYKPSTGSSHEYIELYNKSGGTIDLFDSEGNPWKFTNGVDYTFPPGTQIEPGQYLVVVKNPTAFAVQYPAVSPSKIFGPYDPDSLNNAGEKLDLSMPGDLDGQGQRQYIRIDRVDYSDGSHGEDFPGGIDPWPTEPDTIGQSLNRTVPANYGNDVYNWHSATGSPGTANL